MSEKHPMTCGHMSDSDTCPHECPDSKPSTVIEAKTVESEEPEPSSE